MWGRLWRYIKALGRHWGAFVVTGGPGALLAFIATAAGLTVPWWAWIVLVATGFFVASWRAYDEVRFEQVTLRAELDRVGSSRDDSAHRKEVRDQVARFLADGEKLYHQIWNDASPNFGSSRFLAMTYSDR